jgi:hypothetical protein
MNGMTRAAVAAVAVMGLSGCAGLGLGAVLQPPSFRVDQDRQAELRLLPPSLERPIGGAAVRLHARVGNPNAVGLTLTRIAGQLQLEGRNAARVDFPLGLPLEAGGEVLVPIDLAIDFNDLPGLVDVLGRAVVGQRIGYALDGTVGVDAGMLGQPTFGPMTLLQGDLRVSR